MIHGVFHFRLNIFLGLNFLGCSQNQFQKQPSGGVLEKRCSKKFHKIHRKTPMAESPFLNKVVGLRLAQNIGLLKHTNSLNDTQKIKAKHKFVNKYSAMKKAHLYFISSFHFIIWFNVVLPRHSSISFSNVNLQSGLALIIDYMIIFKFHVHMEWKFQLGLFKLWLNFCLVYHDEFFEYNHNSILNCCCLPFEMKSHHGLMSWNFIPSLKSQYKQHLRQSVFQKWLIIFAKGSILDFLLGSECTSVVCMIIISLQSF